MEVKPPHHSESLETCIRNRHSIRFYKPDPVPDDVLHECLALANLAPSNSNIQNWRIHFARGNARERIVNKLSAEAKQRAPDITPLPEKFKPYRSELGHLLYGPDGYNIERSDKAGAKAASMRNFTYFDAPLVAVITTYKDLTSFDVMSVGLFLQTFMLALTEKGLGACLQGSVTGYPEILREEFKLSDDQQILVGMALGYPAEKNKVNDLVMTRDDVSKSMSMHED